MANPFADKFSHFIFFLFIHICFSFEQNDCQTKPNTFGWALMSAFTAEAKMKTFPVILIFRPFSYICKRPTLTMLAKSSRNRRIVSNFLPSLCESFFINFFLTLLIFFFFFSNIFFFFFCITTKTAPTQYCFVYKLIKLQFSRKGNQSVLERSIIR